MSIVERLGGFWCGKFTNIFPSRKHFDEKIYFPPCPIQIFPIFAPAKTGENGLARESAFFALFLDGESAQFAGKTRRLGRWWLSLLCSCILILNITVERYRILNFVFPGSADPTIRNKDKIGRLRSLCGLLVVPLGLRGKNCSFNL